MRFLSIFAALAAATLLSLSSCTAAVRLIYRPEIFSKED
jgi:hypothetical protein